MCKLQGKQTKPHNMMLFNEAWVVLRVTAYPIIYVNYLSSNISIKINCRQKCIISICLKRWFGFLGIVLLQMTIFFKITALDHFSESRYCILNSYLTARKPILYKHSWFIDCVLLPLLWRFWVKCLQIIRWTGIKRDWQYPLLFYPTPIGLT